MNRNTGVGPARQRGLSMPQIILAIAVGGFVLMTGFRLLPIYLESYQVGSALSSLREAVQSESRPPPPAELRKMLRRRFNVNDLENLSSEIEIYSEDNETVVQVEYERRTPWIANINLVVTFDKQVTVPRR